MTLGDLVRFKAGTGFPKSLQGDMSGPLPFAKVSDMNRAGNELTLSFAENYITYEQASALKAYVHKIGAIAFAKIGIALTSNRRRKITHPLILDNNMMSAEPLAEKLDADFAYYLFLTLDFNLISAGSALPYLTVSALKDINVSIPSIPEQREIAAILGALDDKIGANRKASAALEAMARALYRSWFVDFDPVWAKLEGRPPAHMPPETAAVFPDSFGDNGLPMGWRFGTLAHVAMTARNGVKPEQIHPDTPYIGLEHMPRRSIALSDWGLAADVSSQKSGMLAGDFMFGKLRPYFHKVGVAPVDGICSTDIIVLRPKTPEWGGFVLSVISSDAFVEHTNSGSSGTRMPRTNWSDMAAYEMPLPPVAVAAEFEAIVKPWRDRIVAGIHENQTLATLRDSLLPRLMSGELLVGDARAQVEKAL